MPKHLKKKVKSSYEESINPLNYPSGCHTYENFYSNDELINIENKVCDTEK